MTVYRSRAIQLKRSVVNWKYARHSPLFRHFWVQLLSEFPSVAAVVPLKFPTTSPLQWQLQMLPVPLVSATGYQINYDAFQA